MPRLGQGAPLTLAPAVVPGPLALAFYLYESRGNEDYSGKCASGSGDGQFTEDSFQLLKQNKGIQQVQSQFLATTVNEWKPLLNALPHSRNTSYQKKVLSILAEAAA